MIGVRRPTIPAAAPGVTHVVGARQHALDVVARIAPRLVSWVAPNAPTALCGGTLITDSPSPGEDNEAAHPSCPDCAARA